MDPCGLKMAKVTGDKGHKPSEYIRYDDRLICDDHCSWVAVNCHHHQYKHFRILPDFAEGKTIYS